MICHDIVYVIIRFRSLSDVMDYPMLILGFSIIDDRDFLKIHIIQQKENAYKFC